MVLRLLLQLLSRACPHLRLQQSHRPFLPLPFLPLPGFFLRIGLIAAQETEEASDLFQPHDTDDRGLGLAVNEGEFVVEPGVLGEDEMLAEDDGMDAGSEDVKDHFDGLVRLVGEAPIDLDLAEDIVPSPVGVFDMLFAYRQSHDGCVEALGVVKRHQVRFAARVEGGDGLGVVNTSENQLAEAFVLSRFVDAFAKEVVWSGERFRWFCQLKTMSMFAHGFSLS